MTSDGLSAISNLLLAGYRLTSDGCDRCGGPLMETPSPSSSDGPSSISPLSVCARCDASRLRGVLQAARQGNGSRRRDDDESGEEREEEKERGAGAPPRHRSSATTTTTAPRPRPQRPSDPDLPPPDRDPSSAIGDLLLKGWAMLGEACPACGGTTPLMRERSGGGGGGGGGRTYCVRCRAFVRYEDEGEESEEEEQERAAPAAAAAPAPSPSSTSAGARARGAAGPSPPAARPRTLGGSDVGAEEDGALEEARSALVEALREATAALRSGGGASGATAAAAATVESLGDRASAARLVGECARALAAVRAATGGA